MPPPRLDLQALAQPYGVAYGQTGRISKLEPGESEILDSFVGQEPFGEVIFDPSSVQLFEAKRASEFSSPRLAELPSAWEYVFWKTAEQQARVPEFDEPGVRDKVLYAWRLRKARQMALAKARELAQEIPMGPEVREMVNVSWTPSDASRTPSADLVWRIRLQRRTVRLPRLGR